MSNCTWPRCPCKGTGVKCSEKANAKPKKRKGIAKQSEKGKQKAYDKKLLVQNDMAVYMEIWEERPHVCFEIGVPILKPMLYNFHHVLEKENFPEYRHSKWNIIIVDDKPHTQYHTCPGKTPKIEALRAELLEQHRNNTLKP
jgi:hypothetical protein